MKTDRRCCRWTHGSRRVGGARCIEQHRHVVLVRIIILVARAKRDLVFNGRRNDCCSWCCSGRSPLRLVAVGWRWSGQEIREERLRGGHLVRGGLGVHSGWRCEATRWSKRQREQPTNFWLVSLKRRGGNQTNQKKRSSEKRKKTKNLLPTQTSYLGQILLKGSKSLFFFASHRTRTRCLPIASQAISSLSQVTENGSRNSTTYLFVWAKDNPPEA